MPTYSSPIVGMYYRPPAAAIMKCLHSGCALRLVPEPSNAYDANAVQVMLDSATILDASRERLADALQGMGYSVEDIFAQPEWHLGYLAKEYAAAMQSLIVGASRCEASLAFGPSGKPQANISIEVAPKLEAAS